MEIYYLYYMTLCINAAQLDKTSVS